MTEQKKLRIGIVGLGNIGKAHAGNILRGAVPNLVLTAACEANTALRESFHQANPQVDCFPDLTALLSSGKVDSVLIATPHFSHTPLGIEALEAGRHVLVEKPISVHKADCLKLLDAHRNRKQVFAAMFNLRTKPIYIKIRQLIRDGELGAIQRIQWTGTHWFRTEAYYRSGNWRATWAGEGGGVLLNQCPHQLDLWYWLFGMPQRIRGFCRLGRYHDIEVEDDVTAYMEYENGMTGTFITSTGEFPGTNRLEIAAERGRLIADNDSTLHFIRNEEPISQFSKNTTEIWGKPDTWEVTIPAEGEGEQHIGILKNFVAACLQGEPLIAPAGEGIHSVELANAMVYSSMTDQTLDLPLDEEAYTAKLEELIAGSRWMPETAN